MKRIHWLTLLALVTVLAGAAAARAGDAHPTLGEARASAAAPIGAYGEAIQPARGIWHVETVSGGGGQAVGLPSSLALDQAGHPHISFYSQTNTDLEYAWYDGVNWHVETVDSQGDVGQSNSLALDQAGRPHIAYRDGSNSDLKYAWHDGTGWRIELVDSQGDVGWGPSLALDGAGQAHISFFDATNTDLKYARRDQAGWHTTTIDSQEYVGTGSSLVLDSAGRPHISYFSGYPWFYLKYARYDGTSWSIETLLSTWLPQGQHTSLALDRQDRPHISLGYWNVTYIWHDGARWHTEAIDSQGQTSVYTSLALDGQGQPHISYHNLVSSGSGYDLKYAWRDEMGWHVETIYSEEMAGPYSSSLALDGQGQPHISYYDATHGTLAYARGERFMSLSKQATPKNEAFISRPLTYSLIFTGAGLHIQVWDPLPENVQYVTGSLTSTLSPPAVYKPAARAITWQGVLPTATLSTLPTISFQVMPGLGAMQGETLPVTNTAWLSDTDYSRVISASVTVDIKALPAHIWHAETVVKEYSLGSSLALDGSGRPHISYYDEFNRDFNYAWHDGTSWHIETVDSQEYTGSNTSLALDASGRPHISYAASYGGLKYTWYDGTSWHTETVDTEESWDSSLALDASGRPHMSYTGNSRLKYAWYDGTNWHTETVDTEESWRSSLALDDAGRPHMSYTGNSRLKYAWHDGTSWHTEIVDPETSWGSSLALDAPGHPHISYTSYGMLKYAWYDGTSWHAETVDGGGVSGNISLALDGSGRSHISYYATSDGNIKHARYNGASWHVETVGGPGYADNSLALDGVGRPHVSYGGSSGLEYAWQETLLSLDLLTTPAHEVFVHDNLSYTLVFSGNGLHAQVWDPLPATLRFVAGSLSSNLNPPAVYSPTAHAITWQGILSTEAVESMPSGTAGAIQFQAVPDLSAVPRPFTSLSIANTAWLTDTDYGRVLSSTASVHVRFPALSLDKQVSPGDQFYCHDSVTYSLALSGAGQIARLWDPLPDGLRFVTGSLTSTLSPPAMYDPATRAITWQGRLVTGTQGAVQFQATPDISGAAGMDLLITNTAWLTDTTYGRVITAAAAITASIPPMSEWRIECVDCPKQFGALTDRSLRLDSAERPHLAYGGDHLYYAWHNGSQWRYETVDKAPSVGEYASLALDDAGHPHISYYDRYNSDLKYAWHDGNAWHDETVDSEGVGGQYTSLALDNMGHPHISYFFYTPDWSKCGLKYAWHDGTTWHIETVDSGIVAVYTSLAVDNAGLPHISYIDGYGFSLKYARREAAAPEAGGHDGTTWRIETIDNEGATGPSSLAVDGAGHPHISYFFYTSDWSNRGLKYARREATAPEAAAPEAGGHDGSAWRVETVDNEGVRGCSSLAVDGAGHPHISYSDQDNLKHAWHDGSTWHAEAVGQGTAGSSTSLALDGAGLPHISYSDQNNGDLNYARRDGNAWRVETIDSEGRVGGDTSLALDSAGLPHISYSDQDSHDLKYAWREAAAAEAAGHGGTAWHIETIDSAGRVDGSTSLALDSAGLPHISYSDQDNNDLKYAWHDGSAWHAETVDSAARVGEGASLALDDAGLPHISYSDQDNDGLKYARRETAGHDGSTWHVETVGSAGRVDGGTSLALDDAGLPHISYSDQGNLKHAWHDGSAWHVEAVDDSGGVSGDSSLALDGAGLPHISYYDWYNGDLKYARREAAAPEAGGHDGSAWHVEIVDSGVVGGHISLALNSAGLPHISYQSSYSYDHLKHARREAAAPEAGGHDGTTWRIEIVDRVGQTGSTSLALDSAGLPHISYSDQDNHDLKYAWYERFLRLDMQSAPGSEVYNHEVLTYTLLFSGTGVNACLWDPLPDGVRFVTGSLTGTLATPAVYSPTAHAITWQGILPGSMPADKLGEIRFQAMVDIRGGGSPFETPIIANTTWLTDTDYGRTISATAKLKVRFPPLQLDKRATPTDGARNRDIVTYTLAISGAGQNAILWDRLPAGIYYVSGSLTSTLSPPAVYSPTARTITWQGILPGSMPTDTLGLVRFQATPGITTEGSLNLSLPIVNTAWLTDTDNGTYVRATAIVNGYRLYLPLVMRGR